MNKTVLLEDVCEILDSKRVPITSNNRTKGIYPYYGANGVQDYVDDYIFDDELVLLAEDGGNFGSKDKPIAYRVSGKCWVNNHAHVLKPKECINVDYLCYSLMFYDVSAIVNGATRQKLNQSAMRKMIIPLPSIDEQNQIVFNLDRVNRLIDSYNDTLEKLDELIKSRFVEMFGDPVYNPFGWDKLSLDEMCYSIVDCPHSTPKYTDENTGYMCIRTSIVKKNSILWDKIEYISEEEFKQRIKRKKPQKDDIIYTREGAILGIAAIIDKECNVALGQRSMLLTPDTSKYKPEFICYAMNFDSFFDKVTQGTSGSASPHINVADIKAFKIISPPIKQQQIDLLTLTFLVKDTKLNRIKTISDYENFFNRIGEMLNIKSKQGLSLLNSCGCLQFNVGYPEEFAEYAYGLNKEKVKKIMPEGDSSTGSE